MGSRPGGGLPLLNCGFGTRGTHTTWQQNRVTGRSNPTHCLEMRISTDESNRTKQVHFEPERLGVRLEIIPAVNKYAYNEHP